MCEDDAVQVADPPTAPGNLRPGGAEHPGRVPAPIRRIAVGKQLANVAQGRRAEQGVGHRVKKDIGIAVPYGLHMMGNAYSADNQRPAGPKPVCVVPDSHTRKWRNSFSSGRQSVRTTSR